MTLFLFYFRRIFPRVGEHSLTRKTSGRVGTVRAYQSMFLHLALCLLTPPLYSAYRDSGGKVTLAIFRCRKLTIAAVNGHAAGVGITGLQLPCDFRFVWGGAKLALPFVRRGIPPECNIRSPLFFSLPACGTNSNGG
jgi:hypothetical protein